MAPSNPPRLRCLLRSAVTAVLVAALGAGVAADKAAAAGDLWDIYQIALQQDPVWRSAQREYESARLALPLAKSALRPAVSLSATAGWTRAGATPAGGTGNSATTNPAETYTDNNLTLSAQLPLYDRALRSAVRQAKLQVQAAKIRFAQARDELMLRVADRYFQLLAAQDAREVARSQQTALQRQTDLTAERIKVGLGTRTDLYDAEARLQQAIADSIAADNRIHSARQQLRVTTGAAIDGGIKTLATAAPLPRPSPDSAMDWEARALRANRELRAAEVDLKIAAVEIDKQRLRPSLSLAASQRHSDSGRANSFTPDETSSIGATLSWPLARGGAIRTRTQQAAHQHAAAQHAVESRRRQTRAAAIDAYLAVSGGISQVRALGKAIRAAGGALEAKQQGFRAGLTTNLDVLDAQRDLSLIRSDHLAARYAYILASLRLKQTAGELDEADLQRVNGWLVE